VIKLLAGALLAVTAGYYWEPMTGWSAAGDKCARLANESGVRIALQPGDDAKIFAVGQWLRGNHIVVQLGQKTKIKGYVATRLCAVGDGRVQVLDDPRGWGETNYQIAWSWLTIYGRKEWAKLTTKTRGEEY
jgi:hypothetical protein